MSSMILDLTIEECEVMWGDIARVHHLLILRMRDSEVNCWQ